MNACEAPKEGTAARWLGKNPGRTMRSFPPVPAMPLAPGTTPCGARFVACLRTNHAVTCSLLRPVAVASACRTRMSGAAFCENAASRISRSPCCTRRVTFFSSLAAPLFFPPPPFALGPTPSASTVSPTPASPYAAAAAPLRAFNVRRRRSNHRLTCSTAMSGPSWFRMGNIAAHSFRFQCFCSSNLSCNTRICCAVNFVTSRRPVSLLMNALRRGSPTSARGRMCFFPRISPTRGASCLRTAGRCMKSASSRTASSESFAAL
mmetsp:Transcript_4278/g.18173  ORF Transcript_4278/g.18173 Transcript_4278/m.18173 type:complete len:263 (-) Transcript_4278:312-1100(-)